MDGELAKRSASQTIDILLENDKMRVHWTRYHVVRDVLRHKAYPDSGGELCARMRSCLADEPLHFPSPRLGASTVAGNTQAGGRPGAGRVGGGGGDTRGSWRGRLARPAGNRRRLRRSRVRRAREPR